MSDQLEPELERVARMLAEAGPLPDAPATLRDRVLAVPGRRPRGRRRPRGGCAQAAPALCARAALARDRGRRRRDRGRAGCARAARATARAREHRARGARVRAQERRHGAGRGARRRQRDDLAARLEDARARRREDVYEAWLGQRRASAGRSARSRPTPTGGATISWKVPDGRDGRLRWLWVTNEPAGGSKKPSEQTALWGRR